MIKDSYLLPHDIRILWTRWEVQSTLHLLIFAADTGNAILLIKIFQRPPCY